jgi:hypothetical protein
MMELYTNIRSGYASQTTSAIEEVAGRKPILFSQFAKLLLLSSIHLFVNKKYLAIPAKFDKLILSLGTAYANEYTLDKEQTS